VTPQTEGDIRVGTPAFTAAGWEGTFYPAGLQSRDFLSFHATKFNTVEVDRTFDRTPARSTITGWANNTSPDFVLAQKAPLCRPCSCHGHAVPRASGQAEQEILTPPAVVAEIWV